MAAPVSPSRGPQVSTPHSERLLSGSSARAWPGTAMTASAAQRATAWAASFTSGLIITDGVGRQLAIWLVDNAPSGGWAAVLRLLKSTGGDIGRCALRRSNEVNADLEPDCHPV